MAEPASTPPNGQSRIASLDQYRGLMLLLLIAANFATIFSATPSIIKHANVYGTWHVIDLGAPLFFFAMGLSLGLAFDRSRLKHGTQKTVGRFIIRGLILIGVGMIGVIWVQHHQPLNDWSVLQSIGGAGLVALPFVFLPSQWRWAAGVGLMVLFQLMASVGYADWIKLHDVGGLAGPLGGLAWGGVVLCGATLGELLGNNWPRFRTQAMIMAVTAGLAAWILSWWHPVDKRLATLPYLWLTTALGAALILLLELWHRRSQTNLWWLRILGANSLVIYILQGMMVLVIAPRIPQDWPLWSYISLGLLLYVVCTAIAAWLYRRRIFIRL